MTGAPRLYRGSCASSEMSKRCPLMSSIQVPGAGAGGAGGAGRGGAGEGSGVEVGGVTGLQTEAGTVMSTANEHHPVTRTSASRVFSSDS